MTRGASPALAALFRGLNETGVSWVLLRGRAVLGHPGRDVDLLVSRRHLPAFEDVVFELGGVRLPASMHPWHVFYQLPDPASGAPLKLDVVTEVVYNRALQLPSHLEDGCLARRVKDGELYVLDPTDMFWTVLLHCVLDKRDVSERRAAELEWTVGELRRLSPGEEFFGGICPSGWSPDRAIACVHERDWASLAALGHELAPVGPLPAPTRSTVIARARGVVRAVRRAAYPVLWRRAGLGVIPRVADVVETASVDATVVTLRRRPWFCEVLLLAPEEQVGALESGLRRGHYVRVRGTWNRLTAVGLERVQLSGSRSSREEMRITSLPLGGRSHCRRAVSGSSREERGAS